MHLITIALSLFVIYPSKIDAFEGHHGSRTILSVSSPTFLPHFSWHHRPHPAHPVPTGPINTHIRFNASAYPSRWKTPDVRHSEVQAAIRSIDWNYVPKLAPHFIPGIVYDYEKDEGCWRSNKVCSTPKVAYLPDDIAECYLARDFGLTFDDGPLARNTSTDRVPYLYDYLAHQDQTATLFMIGSNIVAFPDAVLRAFQSGHHLCAHTWSHTFMTMLTNEQIVAELYWTIRAIKEITGVTTRCWRPSYGDVDDRVRAIAHQLGLRTIVWNSDSLDWAIPLTNSTESFRRNNVDKAFESWIAAYQSKNQTHGRIVLMHENNPPTLQVVQDWLPRLKKVFNIKKVHECVPHLGPPYWEYQ
ncbi:hypothetical protein BD560DRAFT_373642 [Blakeslea trispora]|nr:hypothetical protein BD560DRAFT_373642 [Blakeslea trispora]